MKIANLRWWIAALLFASTVLNYVDRQALSILAPLLSKELALSPQQYANILQAFLIPYTLMYLGSGMLADRWGTRLTMAALMSWWSVSNMLHAFAKTALQLGIFRFLLGAGESGNFMVAIKVISEWYPARERALVNGIVQAGASVGAVVAPPLVVWLASEYGWRSAFVATGAAGLLWLGPWLWFFHLPSRHPRITTGELTILAEEIKPLAAGKIGMRELLRWRATWGLLLSRFLSDPVWWFYLFWLPKYLVEQRHFTMLEMGMLAWMPYLTADIGAIAGGLASGWLIRNGWGILNARTAVMLPCALLMPLSVLVVFTPSPNVSLGVICLLTFSHMAWKTNLATVTNDLYPASVVGSLSGIAAFGNGLGGALFTALTGFVVTRFSYDAIFIIMGFLHPCAFLVFRYLVRAPAELTAVRKSTS
jgi:ACS family hexuronate transporter-like MFS transporter